MKLTRKLNSSAQSVILLHVICPILLGAMIYILFRQNTLFVFKWIHYLSLDKIVVLLRSLVKGIKIDNWILYSLSDGIWVYSGTSLLLVIWKYQWNKQSIIWIGFPFFISIIAELMQLFGFLRGTFCLVDTIIIIISFILALFIHRGAE